MTTGKTREKELTDFYADAEADARFFFQELPRFFRTKHETAMKEVEKAVAEMRQKIQKDRLKLEKAHPATLNQYLSELETHLRSWLKGSGPQDSRHFGALAKDTCQHLLEANQEVLQKDADFRRLEQILELATESIGKQVAKKEAAFASDIYRQVALRLNEKYSQILPFQQKPYEVKLRDGEIAERPVSLAREDGAWIGNNWIVPQAIKETELFFPPEEITFPVGIVHLYQTPGWLTYGPTGLAAKKAAAVLSNVLFQRLLSGLPNIKVAIFDSGRSDIKDYEHDLTRDLPADPEVHEKLLEKFMDFGEFKSCMEKWLGQQPENYKKSRNNKSGNKRLFQLYAILILPDDPTEYEHEAYREWMKWWMRQAPRGVGLFVVSTDSVFKMIQKDEKTGGPTPLALECTGQHLTIREGETWTVKKTELNSSWAANAEDWNMGRQVLQKLIRPPQKEEPGVISVRFADEENGEAFCFRYTSSKANTVFIHGKQGSGKSVALLFFILRAARKYSPEELTFYVFDFKNSFALLRNLKHVECLTLSTNEQIMLGVLRDIEVHRQERQERFREVEDKYRKPCRDLDDYNRFRTEHPKDELLTPLPRTLVVVDECKNMLLAKSRAISELLENDLLSKCRAAGIHFLFATTEDIRAELGRGKFDATIEFSQPTPGRFIASLSEGDSERVLVMPTVTKGEIDNEHQTILEINRAHERCEAVPQPLFFDEDKDAGVSVADYVPFTREIRKFVAAAKNGFICSAGIDTQNLRQLHAISFRQGRSGQGLSIFGRWNSPCFRGGMELFLRTLELAARRGDVRVDVLDLENRWEGKTDGGVGRFNVWTDANDFLPVKREWLRAADGTGNGARILVAFDAEDTLTGEEARARLAMRKNVLKGEPDSGVSDTEASLDPAALNALVNASLGEGQNTTDISKELLPKEIDSIFQDEHFLKLASEQGAFLVAVTEKPIVLRDSVVSPDGFGRFLVYSTARELSGLDNSMAENMGYYTDSPGEPPQYFLPFAGDGIEKAILKAAKLQKGDDKR